MKTNNNVPAGRDDLGHVLGGRDVIRIVRV
jgi:hypothetical protein